MVNMAARVMRFDLDSEALGALAGFAQQGAPRGDLGASEHDRVVEKIGERAAVVAVALTVAMAFILRLVSGFE